MASNLNIVCLVTLALGSVGLGWGNGIEEEGLTYLLFLTLECEKVNQIIAISGIAIHIVPFNSLEIYIHIPSGF